MTMILYSYSLLQLWLLLPIILIRVKNEFVTGYVLCVMCSRRNLLLKPVTNRAVKATIPITNYVFSLE